MIYLYGIVTSDRNVPHVPGVRSRPVERVVQGPVAAVVTLLDGEEHRATKNDLLAHSGVLQAIVDDGGDVLPIRFGTSFHDGHELAGAFLQPNVSPLVEMLAGVRGKVEMQVKGAYVEDAIVARIVAGDRRIARLRGSTNVDAQVELGRRVADALARERYSHARTVVDALGRHADATAVAEPAGEFGVVNASFLVPRERLGEFDEAVENVSRRMEGLANLRYLGPLPPYSFVDAGALTVAQWA